MDQRSTTSLLRVVACLVVVAAMGAFIGQLKSLTDLTSAAILTPIAVLIFGVGVAAMLIGIAAILSQRQKDPTEPSGVGVAQNQLFELSMKVEELGGSVRALIVHQQTVAPAELPFADINGASLARLHALLEEVRDLSLLPDAQRMLRLQEHDARRKEAAIQTAAAFIQIRNWPDGERSLGELETAWPADPTVAALRQQMEQARAEAETYALSVAQAQIESDMSLSHWDQAVARAEQVARDFPSSASADRLRQRVEREKAIYTDSTVNRLYDDIRRDVERRLWRRGLEHAQTLLDKFPDHPRSDLIRKQIKTIGENAEIEERQEQETRIGELIRARRFQEALELSEELLVRFPMSPQAAAIEKLLPKIRQFAAGADSTLSESSSA
jgi:hypothetical protein